MGLEMGKHEYLESQKIASMGFSFYSLVMATMRRADDQNLDALKLIFPEIHQELKARYNAPGGILPGETL